MYPSVCPLVYRKGVTSDLAAAVLAGGASRRFGSDKALLSLPDGRTLLAATVEKLRRLSTEVLLVVDRAGRYAELGLPVREVIDRTPGAGPLGGLHAALSAALADRVLLVGCDMPFLSPDLLAYMADLPRTYDALVPVSAGRSHPLHAIYARACLPAADRLLDAGERRLQALLPLVRTREVPPEEWERFDARGLSLFNLNGRADLARMQAVWAESQP
ncbi:MAG: molybdenum cofactor guanylyltransferase [Dehalococcoidia bacterium]|nr:molybdenum cofactor guanylyltransferase [Dehalococcoidia bacterium]